MNSKIHLEEEYLEVSPNVESPEYDEVPNEENFAYSDSKMCESNEMTETELVEPPSKAKFQPKVSPNDYERFIYKCHDCMLGFKRRGKKSYQTFFNAKFTFEKYINVTIFIGLFRNARKSHGKASSKHSNGFDTRTQFTNSENGALFLLLVL